jgi:spermidine/putrescine transport system permease protein
VSVNINTSILGALRNLIPNIKPKRQGGEPGRHARRAMQRQFSLSQIVFFVTIVFLFLPVFVLVVYSFNESRGMHWTGFSLGWYRQMFATRELWQAFANSIIVAVTSAVAATAIGTIGAIGINWYRFRLRTYVQTISFLPMILPEIIIGVSLSVFFASTKIPLGLFTVFIAHTTFNLPFVFLMVMARLDEFDFSIIEAARDLGANERQILLRVTVPVCMPGIIAGMLTAVTLSLEDFVITFFVAGSGASTLPIFIYSAIARRGGVTPVISALSVVLIVGTIILCFVLRKFLKYIAAK